MRTRTIGLVIFGLCVIVTLAAVVLALFWRPPDEQAAVSFGLRGADAVALIKLDGVITDAMVTPQRTGRGRENVLTQLRRAERDRSVKAVVLRVNSPGGSAAASHALYTQIRRMSDGGKKVVIHFTDVAASGGYYVGAAGDRIVSQPAAITGSIGVIITSLDVSGLYEKIGIRERVIKTGPYKDILSPTRDITPEEQAILEKLVHDTLDQFVRVVAEGRNLPEAEVRLVADGRVFSGTEALNLRLVDEVGDQYRAVQVAAELAGLEGEPRIILYEQPRSGTVFDFLDSLSQVNQGLDGILPRSGISIRYEWRG